jgi:hypothetical protein
MPSYGRKSKLRTIGELYIKFRILYRLLVRSSKLSVVSKLILHKQVLRPVLCMLSSFEAVPLIPIWQWFNAKKKELKCTVNAPCYVRNSNLYSDLGTEMFTDIIAKFANFHEKRLQNNIKCQESGFLKSEQYD